MKTTVHCSIGSQKVDAEVVAGLMEHHGFRCHYCPEMANSVLVVLVENLKDDRQQHRNAERFIKDSVPQHHRHACPGHHEQMLAQAATAIEQIGR